MGKSQRWVGPGWFAALSWRRLVVTASIGVLLAVAVGVLTFAQLAQTRAPQAALMIDPHNARANSRLAELMFASGQQNADADELLRLSSMSLRRQAFNPEALRMLALGFALKDDVTKARPAFRFAGLLSKRDAPTNIWLIEDAVQRDSVPDALALFDRSLRVEDSLRPVLFPILANALSDPVIAKAAVPIFEARPVWARFFVKYAMNEADGAPALGALSLQSKDGGVLEERETQNLVAKLAREGDPALAARIYRRFGPSSDGGLVNDPGFRHEQRWPPFDWERSRNPDVAIFAAAKGGIEFTVDDAEDVSIARQLLTLSPGRYRVASRARLAEGEGGQVKPSLRISCGGDEEQPLLKSAFFDGANGKIDTGFAVPGGCAYQWLELHASGARRPQPATVDSIVIKRE